MSGKPFDPGKHYTEQMRAAAQRQAKPYPKSRQLARGAKRYRRKVASAKTWAKLYDEKVGPCRICNDPGTNGRIFGRIQLHHVVSREDFGDDTADNLVPVCPDCHEWLHLRIHHVAALLLKRLTDAEYAYMIERGGEDYPERAYGIRYERV